MASVDYTILRRCRYATEEYERLTHLFKSKTHQPFLKTKKQNTMLLTHCQFCLFAVLFSSNSLLAWRACPIPPIWMCVCIYMCIFFTNIYHVSASVLWAFTEEGLLARIPHDFLAFTAASCSSWTCMYHSVFFSHNPSICCTTANFTPIKFKCWVGTAVSPGFLFWHKGLNLKCSHCINPVNLHKLKQQWLFVGRVFSSLFHGDGLNWHWRLWSIVTDTRRSVTLTLCELTDLPLPTHPQLFPQTSLLSELCAVGSDPVYRCYTSLCTGFSDKCTL